ncbi:MAG: HNH endonuclease [Chlamydiae bacterium]|nr:HNH endonuclease [Chlamydiota bacterium]MBI3276509.1 HNH endonuclease [Chlamydiota bacterium]
MEDFEKVNYKKFRDKILHRDTYHCQKCKKEFATDELDIHHVIPKSHGGSSNAENVHTLCKKHHRLLHKENNTLDEYAFEFKHFNNVEKMIDTFVEESEESEDYGESESELEELGDIDIEDLEDFDNKRKDFDEEV